MPVHLLTENDFQAMEQELAEVLEAWGGGSGLYREPGVYGKQSTG